MQKLSLIVCAFVAVGCRDKKDKEHPPMTKGMNMTFNDDLSRAGLATVDDKGPKLMFETLGSVVQIAADGSLEIGTAGTQSKDGTSVGVVMKSSKTFEGSSVSSPRSSLATLARDLGLPEIAKRRPSAFAAEGVAGSGSDAAANPTDVQFAQLGHPEPATSVPVQTPRMSSAFAIAHPFDVSAGIVVFADAKAPATAVVDVLAITGGFIAVKRGAELGALPFAFDRQQPPFAAPNRSWLELRLGKPSILAMVPGKPMPSDMNTLPEVIKASGMKALDILVAADSTVSDLVAAIELARGAGIDAIGLGRAPALNTPETMTREVSGPRVLAWDFFMQNMDKTDVTPFRTAFDATVEPIHTCYGKAAAKAPQSATGLGGVGRVELVVETTGKVSDLQTTGIAPPLATCTADALKGAAFPPIATPVKITAQLAFVPR